ncbi:protein-tyrosine phosphatase-like protein [Aspergillus coremiiformis]|uniref:protein-tyrosine-phosphatase n=1 Tax=Aspergillus coremiiformis TaxID=138285 RepID=A0A5N6YUR3_9EURO|nr:protein-tyrosine phosphatase-like protein [Aspergillus coremiiformis]
MSTITGPRSPTSPWPQDQPSRGHPPPAAFFSLCDPQQSPLHSSLSPHNTAAERSGPNYFSISVESPSNNKTTDDTVSYARPSIPNPKPHSLPKKAMLDDYINQVAAGSTIDERKASAIYKLSLSRGLPKKHLVSDRSGISTNTISENGRTIAAERCGELLESSPNDVMLLDVRPFAHFAKENIKGSLNLCIPTTLLKRPSFDTQKLANTFTNESDKMNFGRWNKCRYIIVYDAGTSDMKDAGPLANVLRKFTAEGWDGEALVLQGGFSSFSKRFPALVQQQYSSVKLSNKPSLMHIDLPSVAPIAGGCALPDSSRPTIPFFGNIRQHMDLLGGVGQIPLQLPEDLTNSTRQSLPPWLREATDSADQGRSVSEKFLELEKKELERMKQALTYNKSPGNSTGIFPETFRVAGLEKGTKNRYNDIYPFDHSRVKLQDVPPGECDYVNANYMKAEYSKKCYIATQAPVPDTFNDFWRVIWEQDIRLIVSLTAEIERGQIKCHPFWGSGKYGSIQVNNFSQKYLRLDSLDSRQVGSRPHDLSLETEEDSGKPCIVVRHFGLSHSAFPFQPLREVSQLQYPYWPDFGTTSQPAHLLKLIEQCDKVRSATDSRGVGTAEPRPVLVHCSAGCGRTGTFCTVDSVLDMLKQRPAEPIAHSQNSQAISTFYHDCIRDGNLDLIAKTVADFRSQRPSMVQNLSQFVLCYESVLEWFVSQTGNERLGQ